MSGEHGRARRPSPFVPHGARDGRGGAFVAATTGPRGADHMGKLVTGRTRASTRRRARRGVVVLVAALLAGGLTSCRPHAHGCEPGAGRPEIPRHSPWARHLCRRVDQHPPVLANGIVYRDG